MRTISFHDVTINKHSSKANPMFKATVCVFSPIGRRMTPSAA